MKIDDAKLLQTLPYSIAKDETVQNVANALYAPIADVTKAIYNALLYSRIDTLEEETLDALAWQYHMDIYDATADIETKREAVKTAIRYHRYKGTVWAVKEAAALASKHAEVVEWFDYGGKPYHFKAVTLSGVPDLDELRTLIKVMTDAKNVRSWIDGIEYKTTSTARLFAVSGEYDRETLTKEIELLPDGGENLHIGIGAAWTKYIDIAAAEFSGKTEGTGHIYAVSGELEREVLYGD